MARTKAQTKTKEPVKVRFKQLANGNQSIYLDCYVNGKRSYEFLNLYLVKENTPVDKQQNKATLNAANNIKAQRVIEIANGKAGITKDKSTKILLNEWMQICKEAAAKEPQGASWANQIGNAIWYIDKFCKDVALADVDAEFCRGFARYLKTAKSIRFNTPLKPNTANIYFVSLAKCLRMAVNKKLIAANPTAEMTGKEKPQAEQGQRDFLTIDEVKQMMAADCPNQVIKQAYLFSCLCGLRISDVRALVWGDIKGDEVQIRMQKTKHVINVPLSDEAKKWLPNRDNNAVTDRVFNLPKQANTICTNLKKWAAAAGVEKVVTFHTARHTFATIMLTQGADLYTISKLLGHSKMETTQIYATLLDEAKAKAVSKFDGLFG